jgi:hypothetical protein
VDGNVRPEQAQPKPWKKRKKKKIYFPFTKFIRWYLVM